VSTKYLKSTVIIGDSNTRFLKFGSGAGTFGHNIPGERIEAIHSTDINPLDCCGYKTIILHCGINGIKHHRVNSSDKMRRKFEELKTVINQIRVLCPKSRLVVSPILPTRSQELNNRAKYFNSLLFEFNDSLSYNGFTTLNFNVFADRFGNLRSELGRYWNQEDQLHLGSQGISLLVRMIREKVYNSTISPARSYRPYNSVVQGGGVNRVGRDHVAVISRQSGTAAT
ncbi:MAG: hypothetical protein GY816_14980, partial [Cytophagales bacterium]|nr:hypothetical protein [Cytophagales bacterium]